MYNKYVVNSVILASSQQLPIALYDGLPQGLTGSITTLLLTML